MDSTKIYNKDEVINQLLSLVANLDNCTSLGEGIHEGDNSMPKRLAEKVVVNGKTKWLHGYSMQELFDNYVKLLINEGIVEWIEDDKRSPLFGDYLREYYGTFKQKQQSNTVVNRGRIIRNHIEPAFGSTRIDHIRSSDIQRWFNSLGKTYSKETILKIKNIMNPVFDAAVEDDILTKNPLASKNIEISGHETIHHKALPKEKMDEIKAGLTDISGKEQVMAALLCYTGMRFEEVLGLRWEDIDDEWITVQRAVVHPKRNQPEIKTPKTKTSIRKIPLHPELKQILSPMLKHGFLLYADEDKTMESPICYSTARRTFERIRKHFHFEGYSAHDFRDTCATEWRGNGMPLDMIARILGHSKTETTEKRYVKYRTDILEKAREMM